ncbi:isoprenylcysteine carboxyl methyltransferase family protein [Shouchella clausii]|uniref:isoprenylcysteine carboxyl methyltransferase family protein n=1 Tax=Shouchella clausii TaxID=79880 RepID=UPI0031FD423C
MTWAYMMIALIIIQRLVEVRVARRNERWLKAQGGVEAGTAHYPWMVTLHCGFFISLLIEVTLSNIAFSCWSAIPLAIVVIAQIIRIWALSSLGKYWNTKIIVLPEAPVIEKGPYRFLRHPNYMVVVAEIAFVPLLFQAYWTAIVFSLLNAAMLTIRIPTEEAALQGETDYGERFKEKKRFWLV